jgi:penicillin-binding protein A
MTDIFFSRKIFWGLIILTAVNLVVGIFILRTESVANPLFGTSKDEVYKAVGPFIRSNSFPKTIDYNGKTEVKYTLDQNFQKRIENVFNLHKPDHGAVVAIDADSGEVLTMVSYSRRSQGENLAVRASFPAASIFKIVTAAAAIDQKKLNADSRIGYGGGNHTLYRKNVEAADGRWTRYISVREAFSRSINTVFAKMGLFFVGPKQLQDYAERFLFNRTIQSDMPIESGIAHIPSDDRWALAEAASGFTRKNTMSPLQGALMAAAIANDGTMPEPYIVESLSGENGKEFYTAGISHHEAVMEKSTAQEMRRLMSATITSGTSRKSFRSIIQGARIAGLEIGGKTGSLTGTDPVGKYDWFVGYGRYHDKRVAVAVVTIHEKVWRIRSSQIAADFFRHYFKIPSTNIRIARYTRHKRSRRAYN